MLHDACSFAASLTTRADLRLLPQPGATAFIASLEAAPASVFTLIGPEGGFSDEEVSAAATAGFTGVCLGPRILRAETVPATLGALLQSKWGDLT